MRNKKMIGIIISVLVLATSVQIYAVCILVEPENYMITITDGDDYVRATGSFDMITVKQDGSSAILARIEQSAVRVKLVPTNVFSAKSFDFKAERMVDFDVIIYIDGIQSPSWGCSVEGNYDTTIQIEDITLEFLFAETSYEEEVFGYTSEVQYVFALIMGSNIVLAFFFVLLVDGYYTHLLGIERGKVRRLERFGNSQSKKLAEIEEHCKTCPHTDMGKNK